MPLHIIVAIISITVFHFNSKVTFKCLAHSAYNLPILSSRRCKKSRVRIMLPARFSVISISVLY